MLERSCASETYETKAAGALSIMAFTQSTLETDALFTDVDGITPNNRFCISRMPGKPNLISNYLAPKTPVETMTSLCTCTLSSSDESFSFGEVEEEPKWYHIVKTVSNSQSGMHAK